MATCQTCSRPLESDSGPLCPHCTDEQRKKRGRWGTVLTTGGIVLGAIVGSSLNCLEGGRAKARPLYSRYEPPGDYFGYPRRGVMKGRGDCFCLSFSIRISRPAPGAVRILLLVLAIDEDPSPSPVQNCLGKSLITFFEALNSLK